MNHTKIVYEGGFFRYKGGTSSAMDVLGIFLATDVGCDEQTCLLLKDWALADKDDPNSKFGHFIGGDATFLEEDDDSNIHVVHNTGRDEDDHHYVPACLKMTRQQFVKLLDDWEEKVCKRKPKTVIIKHENDQFIIETSNE